MTDYYGPGWTTIGELKRRQGGSPSIAQTTNPFKRDSAGKVRSLSDISKAIKSDPGGARGLCRAAGENESIWFGDNPK